MPPKEIAKKSGSSAKARPALLGKNKKIVAGECRARASQNAAVTN
jgi:hypothetical protein